MADMTLLERASVKHEEVGRKDDLDEECIAKNAALEKGANSLRILPSHPLAVSQRPRPPMLGRSVLADLSYLTDLANLAAIANLRICV